MTASTVATADADAGAPHDAEEGGADRAGMGKLGMWLFLVTDAMGFGGLLLAYAVLRVRAAVWPSAAERLSIPLAAGMTFALITSSLTVMLALSAMRLGRRTAAMAWLAVTIAAGALFLLGQVYEYDQLLRGAQPMGLTSDLFASTFYAITGFHGVHVLAGVVYLAILLTVSGRGRATAGHYQVAALFWHFVDFAWIAIFTFVYLLPAA